MKEISSQGAQVNLNQILNMVAPSFTQIQPLADGTDHIDPAQLRGLGPDQVLVQYLQRIRRYPDLKSIPAFAIEKIEVLRDGVNHGSDAIAGVININMKKTLKN
jgi:iron complex outermembrane receptor protein